MKKFITLVIALVISMSITTVAQARNTKYLLAIAPALQTPVKDGSLDGSVKFYFANQRHPRILQNLGSYDTNRKTNSFGKSDLNACNWAFLSALSTLEKRAHQVGANAVVNVVSYYDKNAMASSDKFECHAGAVVAGVALKGDFVRIAGR